MAASVQVLCPNGRRQNVKVNPNTKLLQILEEVCQRQGYVPPEDYKLVQGRKEFDLSLSVRYASVPNNAKLEMVRSVSSRTEQDVTIALQIESGQRHQECFQPSQSIWDILLHYENKMSELKGILTRIDTSHKPALHPVCIYMREEVLGEEALKATTLKKLGLTSGKAIIRHLHRPVEDFVLGEIADKVEREKQKQARLEEIALKKSELHQMEEIIKQRKQPDLDVSSTIPENQTEDREPPQIMELGPDATSIVQEIQAGPEAMETNQIETTISQSAIPDRQIPQRQEQPSSPRQDLSSLNTPGVIEVFTPDDFNDLTPQEQAIAQRLAARFLPHLQGSGMILSTSDAGTSGAQNQTQYQPFENFKFPEETKGKTLISSSSSGPAPVVGCDREAILYDSKEPLTPKTTTQQQDLPDDFFEVTQNDVRVMYRDLQNAVNRMEDQPLMTTAMRKERMESMFDAYDRVVIRVQFPDKSVLQGLFRPRETVSALREFVKENLQHKTDKFYLYTTPPKEVLKDETASLAASKLAPAALVYFGSDTHRDIYASKKLRENMQPRLEAEKIVTRALQNETNTLEAGPSSSDSGSGHSSEDASFSSRRMHGGASSSGSASRSATLPSGTQVPKWLKLSKK